MAISKKEMLYMAVALAFVAILLIWLPLTVKANPSVFAPTKATASATSTLAYLTPGTATTTLSYDSLDGESFKIDKLKLAIQYTASSTGPTLKFRLEDSPNNIDWYPRAVAINSTLDNATTTMITGNFSEYQWTVATTTDNGGSGTPERIHTSLVVEAPMRYVRAIFYVPTGGGNGGLWVQFNPIKEQD